MIPSSVLSRQRENYVVKPCPLCNADVRYCLINFTEKVLMCANVYCDYPFGDEDLQFSPLEFEANIEAARSILEERYESALSSAISPFSSSDIETFNKVLQPEENPKNLKRHSKFDFVPNKKLRKELEDLEYQINKLNKIDKGADHDESKSLSATSSDLSKFNKEDSEFLAFDGAPTNSEAKSESDLINEKLAEAVEDLKSLTNELNNIKLAKSDKADVIKNQKWLEKLMKLQSSSGRRLLKEEEMELLEEKAAGDGGWIDTDSNKNDMSSLNDQMVNAYCNRNAFEDAF